MLAALTLLSFGLALGLLVAGHLVRVARWSVLLRQIGTPWSAAGFLALSLAFVLNGAVPLRLGELARGLYYASRTRSDIAYVLATIVVERAFDLAVVCALVVVLATTGLFTAVALLSWLAGALVAVGGVLLIALAVDRSPRFRYLVWLLASIFNARIRLLILDFAWSLPEVLREAGAYWPRIAVQTTAMWTLYLLSYAVLARVMQVGFQPLFETLHGAPLTPAFVSFLRYGPLDAAVLVSYALAPFALVLVYSVLRDRLGVSFRGAVSWISEPLLYVHRLPRARFRFFEAEQYSGFLMRRFSGASDLVSDFETNAIDDAIVQRMFRGGSDALTAVVQVGNELRVRKYALGNAATKLQSQCDWLQRWARDLPLVHVVDQSRVGSRFLYDMTYSDSSRDLFDVIHASDLEQSWATLQSVLDTISAHHQRTASGTADESCIARYAGEKVAANLRAIKAAFPLFFEPDRVNINGVDVDLALLDRFAHPAFLPARLRHRTTAVIHGDLTVENVLADPARASRWFLIDPNVGNVFETPLLDYAKLLQSLHLGYESLNRDIACRFGDGSLTFPIARTAQYAVLHDRMTAWMRDRLGDDAVREARLHEIVHYFRLTPYKFRKSTQAGLVFLGCLCLLLHRYFDEFERC